jgi:type IV secretory pathway protease TraF
MDTATAPPGVVVDESGYRAVKVTGSHIPVLVPTSPTARPLPSASRVRTMSPDEFDRLVTRGQR